MSGHEHGRDVEAILKLLAEEAAEEDRGDVARETIQEMIEKIKARYGIKRAP